MDTAAITAYIESNPQVRFVKPVVKGTRTTVAEVLANNMSAADIQEDYPAIGAAQVRACLLYAAYKESIVLLAAGGQRLVEHVEQGAHQAADAGLRNAEAGGLVFLQEIGFEVGQQEKEFCVGAGQNSVGPLPVHRKLAPVASKGVVAVVRRPTGRKKGQQVIKFSGKQTG